MIYLFTDYNLITEDIEEQLISKLPPLRKEKALRYKLRDGRLSCILGYLLFLYGYRRLYNKMDLPDFEAHENAKPFLANAEDIHFNISHCKAGVCCVFSSKEVGIDIQEIRSGKLDAMLKVCSDEEKALIHNSSCPDKEFCRIWSIKEAISKQSGDGIFRDIKNISSSNLEIFTELIDDDKYLTVAGYSREDFSINKLSLSQLLEL